MIIFVVNCGSSSIKYQLLNMNGEQVLAKGLIERIGMEGSVLKHTPTGKYTVDISAIWMPTEWMKSMLLGTV